VGAAESHIAGKAYHTQYDEECAEVETYRQKQVLTPSSPPLGDIDDSISGTCTGRQTFWSSGETVPATGCGYEQHEEVSPRTFDAQ
jgi:hypothetical protein